MSDLPTTTGPEAQPAGQADHDPPSDAALVLATRDGSRQAFAALYDRYAGLVRAVAYDHTRDRASANDLAQETFLRAFRGIGTLRDPARVLPWLIQIARHVAIEGYRRDRRRRQPADDSLTRLEAVRQAEDPLELEELLDAVAELPEPDRTAVHLHYLCGQPADHARGVLGLSRSGFYKTLERARQRLRERLDPTKGAKR